MNKKVFVLEDDEAISQLIVAALSLAEIDCVTFSSCQKIYNGIKALSGNDKPNLAILDIMLPDGSGLDVLKKLKGLYPLMPVIMLSALGAETDKVKGLNAGADDYVSKPFGVLEFGARVRAHLRRAESAAEKEQDKSGGEKVLVVKNIVLDESKHEVTIDGKRLELNQKEFLLLKFFMENVGLVLSRDKILERVWGYDAYETRTVDNHVARLRKYKIPIETVFGSGYKL